MLATNNNQNCCSNIRICAIVSGVIIGLVVVGGLIAALVVTSGRTINGQPAPSLLHPCINVTSLPYFTHIVGIFLLIADCTRDHKGPNIFGDATQKF